MNRNHAISDKKNQNKQLRWLLSLHDVEFIEQSYLYVLDRKPDPDGFKYSVSRIRAGFCKLTVLKDMRRSPEGQQVNKSFAKLDRLLHWHSICNFPVLGAIFRIFLPFESDTTSERQLRAILNELGRLRIEFSAIGFNTASDNFSTSKLSKTGAQSDKQLIASSLGPRERQIFSQLTAQLSA